MYLLTCSRKTHFVKYFSAPQCLCKGDELVSNRAYVSDNIPKTPHFNRNVFLVKYFLLREQWTYLTLFYVIWDLGLCYLCPGGCITFLRRQMRLNSRKKRRIIEPSVRYVFLCLNDLYFIIKRTNFGMAVTAWRIKISQKKNPFCLSKCP